MIWVMMMMIMMMIIMCYDNDYYDENEDDENSEGGDISETGNTTDKESHVRKLEKIFTYYKAASIVRMMESVLTKVSSFRHSPCPVF